jgi:hypothetical protein
VQIADTKEQRTYSSDVQGQENKGVSALGERGGEGKREREREEREFIFHLSFCCTLAFN